MERNADFDAILFIPASSCFATFSLRFTEAATARSRSFMSGFPCNTRMWTSAEQVCSNPNLSSATRSLSPAAGLL